MTSFERMWATIRYRDFWDVPRLFTCRDDHQAYVFDCAFDEGLDDYPEVYKVYSVSAAATASRDWHPAWESSQQLLGEIAVRDVHFDPTRRKEVDLDRLMRLSNPSE